MHPSGDCRNRPETPFDFRITLNPRNAIAAARVSKKNKIPLGDKKMNIRKTLTALAAALLMITISAPVLAFECEGNGNVFDPVTIADNLELLAISVRCDGPYASTANPGIWPHTNPIWERRGSGSCDVHQNLAEKLFQQREFDDSSKPRKNPFNDAEGAAWKVGNEKYEDAIQKLEQFITTVLKSRLNRNFDPNVGAAQMLANELVIEAEEASICINQLLP